MQVTSRRAKKQFGNRVFSVHDKRPEFVRTFVLQHALCSGLTQHAPVLVPLFGEISLDSDPEGRPIKLTCESAVFTHRALKVVNRL